jgi:hypothetical protein
MTPKVIDILNDFRKQLHTAIADRACVSDTHALYVLDQLIVADAGRQVASRSNEETVVGLSDDTPNPYTEAELEALQKKLAEAEASAKRQREQDDKLIKGLQEELKKRQAP